MMLNFLSFFNLDISRKGKIVSIQFVGCAILCALISLLWFQTGQPIFAVILCALPIGAIIVLKNPFLMVLFFIVFSFFRMHEVFPFLMPFKLPLLLAFGSLVSIAWSVFISKKIKMFLSAELITFMMFFVLVCVGILFATNREISIQTMTDVYIKVAIMLFSISWMATNKELYPLVIRVFSLSGLIVGLVALYNKSNGLELVEGTRVTIGRSIGSMLGDPNDLSLVLLFPAGFALSLLLGGKHHRMDQLLGIVTIIVIFFAILATQSRGGLLGLISVFGVFGWFKVKNKALLISAGIVGVGVLFAIAGIDERASGGADEEGIDESAMGRLHAWMAAIRMAVHNPLTGVGIHNFYYNYFDYSSYWDGKNYVVHSTWFGIIAETGFLGFSLFMTMIGKRVLGLLRIVDGSKKLSADNTSEYKYLYTMNLALLSAFTGLLISGTFLTMSFTWPLYIVLALSIAFKKTIQDIHRQSLSQNDN